MTEIFGYVIKYVDGGQLDPGFLIIDNTANERPDWYEYFPIRKFLSGRALDEDAFYGFLSPRFKEKTNADSAVAYDFVRANDSADVVLMTPSLHLTAYHWNTFLYGEACHPGLLETSKAFLQRIGMPTDLDELVTTSRNEVNSNYIFAKPAFWREWLAILEKMVAITDAPEDPLGKRLRSPTSYRGKNAVEMKVFVMERIPTLLLARDARFRVASRAPFAAKKRLYKLPGAVICDALKMAYSVSGERQEYRYVFNFFSKAGKTFSLALRLGNFVGVRAIRQLTGQLSAFWTRSARTP